VSQQLENFKNSHSEYIKNIRIIFTELSLREGASPTIKQNPNELALLRPAPETIPQLPQQPSRGASQETEKKPKKRSRLRSQNLAPGSYSCHGHS